MNKLTRWLGAVTIGATLSFSGFSAAQNSVAPPDEVRLAYAGGPRVWILGKIDQSFDKAFETPVKWIAFDSGADVLSLFAAKEIDIARFGSNPVAGALARKLPIEVIGVPEIIATSERLIATEGIGSLQDLEGKRVAFPANSTAQFAFEMAIQLAGVDRRSIRTVTLRPAEIVAAWQRGDIDAAYVWGPFSQQLEQAGGKEIFATKDLAKDGVLVFNNYAVRTEFAQQHPEIVASFIRVAQDKVEEYKADPESAAQKIAEHLSLPVETVSDVLAGLEYPTAQEQLTVDYIGQGEDKAGSRIANSYAEAAKFLADTGEIRRADIPESYAPFLNTEYLERIAVD